MIFLYLSRLINQPIHGWLQWMVCWRIFLAGFVLGSDVLLVISGIFTFQKIIF